MSDWITDAVARLLPPTCGLTDPQRLRPRLAVLLAEAVEHGRRLERQQQASTLRPDDRDAAIMAIDGD